MELIKEYIEDVIVLSIKSMALNGRLAKLGKAFRGTFFHLSHQHFAPTRRRQAKFAYYSIMGAL